MGGKHQKYAYVKRIDGWYVKVRVFKNREEGSSDKYLVVGFKTKKAPTTFPIIDEEELPGEVRRIVREV